MAKTSNQSDPYVGVLADKQRKISWNTGAVPFGSGSLRNLGQSHSFFPVGPGSYTPQMMTLVKPIAIKGENPKSI